MRSPHPIFLILTILVAKLVLTCGLVVAQTKVVFPGNFKSVEGAASTAIPFGLSNQVRLQAVYHSPPPKGQRSAMLREIAIRPDGNAGSGYARKQWISLFAYVGLCPHEYDRVSKNFDENRATALTQIFGGAQQKLSLPAMPPLKVAQPRPFAIRFKLPKPWIHRHYDDGYLLLELVIMLQPKGTYLLDTPFICSSKGTPFGKSTAACAFANKAKPKLAKSGSFKLGGQAVWTLSNTPPKSIALFVFGLSKTGPFWDGKLPYDMTKWGAPGCFALIDWFQLYPVATNDRGTASVSLPIPQNRLFFGWTYRCQTLTLAPAANLLGVVWGDGLEASVCGPVQCSQIVAFAKTGIDKVKTGTVQIGTAPIIELTY